MAPWKGTCTYTDQQMCTDCFYYGYTWDSGVDAVLIIAFVIIFIAILTMAFCTPCATGDRYRCVECNKLFL